MWKIPQEFRQNFPNHSTNRCTSFLPPSPLLYKCDTCASRRKINSRFNLFTQIVFYTKKQTNNFEMQSQDLTDHLSDEIISKLENGSDLDEVMSGEMFHPDSLYMDEREDENEPDDIIILHMDIREPLSSLKFLLEKKVGVKLKKYTFWLQDSQILEPHKNLVDQCVKGEGLVQINVQVQTTDQRINIVDVLKPTEAALAAVKTEATSPMESSPSMEDSEDSIDALCNSQKIPTDQDEAQRPCLNWVLDSKFKKEQTRLRIPEDPVKWTVPHVKHWLQWAMRQFYLTKITISEWNITGERLCSLTHEEFRKKVPVDPGNVFWTHLQLLKECKFVSIVHTPQVSDDNFDTDFIAPPAHARSVRKPQVSVKKTNHHEGSGGSNTNGPTQLWQFLLEILTDREHRNIIQWVGNDGEFKLVDPEKVAILWGEKKNKPAMNYEKLSRALRYYYDGDMISKVSGKRFAYKFDCDLKMLIGYDAGEISKLVNETKDYLESCNYESEEEA